MPGAGVDAAVDEGCCPEAVADLLGAVAAPAREPGPGWEADVNTPAAFVLLILAFGGGPLGCGPFPEPCGPAPGPAGIGPVVAAGALVVVVVAVAVVIVAVPVEAFEAAGSGPADPTPG